MADLPESRNDCDSTDLDPSLRTALEPAPGQAERIARAALALARGKDPETARGVGDAHSLSDPVFAWGAATAIIALLLVSALIGPRIVDPTADLAEDANESETGADSALGDERATLRISNLDGVLTVSTDAGTRWVVFDDT